MSRRKKITLQAKNTSIHDLIVSELSKNTKLAEEYDMDSIEITIKKRYDPHIQDVDKAIRILLNGLDRSMMSLEKPWD